METKNNILDQYFQKRIARLKRNCIIACIIILAAFAAFSASAQTKPQHHLTVIAGKTIIRLNQADIDYVKTQCVHAPVMRGLITAMDSLTVIRNHDMGDFIIEVMKHKNLPADQKKVTQN